MLTYLHTCTQTYRICNMLTYLYTCVQTRSEVVEEKLDTLSNALALNTQTQCVMLAKLNLLLQPKDVFCHSRCRM